MYEKMPCHISDGPDFDDWLEDQDDFDQVEPDDFNEYYRRYRDELLDKEDERERQERNDLLKDIGRLV